MILPQRLMWTSNTCDKSQPTRALTSKRCGRRGIRLARSAPCRLDAEKLDNDTTAPPHSRISTERSHLPLRHPLPFTRATKSYNALQLFHSHKTSQRQNVPNHAKPRHQTLDFQTKPPATTAVTPAAPNVPAQNELP